MKCPAKHRQKPEELTGSDKACQTESRAQRPPFGLFLSTVSEVLFLVFPKFPQVRPLFPQAFPLFITPAYSFPLTLHSTHFTWQHAEKTSKALGGAESVNLV